jgi:hypothetical protein
METALTAEELAKIQEDSDFIKGLAEEYMQHIGGSINADNMQMLTTSQHTLLAYSIILDEVMEGGFIQLIMNGWGPYIFFNPFATILREWGAVDLARIINKAKKEYQKYRVELEKDCSDEEFMALYEKLDKLNELGDDFLDDIQEVATPLIAQYVRDNMDEFTV